MAGGLPAGGLWRPAGFLTRREAWTAPETSYDFAVLAYFVDQLARKRNTGAMIDAEEVDGVREALDSHEVRQSWLGRIYRCDRPRRYKIQLWISFCFVIDRTRKDVFKALVVVINLSKWLARL